MAISSLTPITYGQSLNTPNFKGAPKVNASTMKTAAAVLNNASAQGEKAKNGLGKLWDNIIEKGIIQPVLKPVVNSKFMSKFADWSANVDNLPSHMATAGSVVTTYFYANRTLNTLNKDEEQKKRAKTLVLNQVLVAGVSTALAYGANGALGNISKKLGYKFREANQGHAKLSSRMKGFDIAKQLLIFTMMYRYVAPVFVTPVASKLSKVYQNWKASKNEVAQANNQQPANIEPAKQTKVNNTQAAKA